VRENDNYFPYMNNLRDRYAKVYDRIIENIKHAQPYMKKERETRKKNEMGKTWQRVGPGT
jgi:hypothetical protein